MKSFWLALLILLIPGSNALAAKAQSNILDFEAELIEGQSKRPDMFLQTEAQSLSLESILFLRKDFNDFQQVDRFRRPGYFERTRGVRRK